MRNRLARRLIIEGDADTQVRLRVLLTLIKTWLTSRKSSGFWAN